MSEWEKEREREQQGNVDLSILLFPFTSLLFMFIQSYHPLNGTLGSLSCSLPFFLLFFDATPFTLFSPHGS